jgi:PAS domain S-box-containing protein
MSEEKPGNSFTLFWRYVAGAVIVWTAIIAGSLISNINLLDNQSNELVRKEAIANFNKDQGFRLWGTKHGGVYVPVTGATPPSPYLSHIPERDIETPSGRQLTLLNPAYMVRQLMEDNASFYGVMGKITGLVVLRPGNAPDQWERSALKKLKAGIQEVSEISTIGGRSYFRMMRPMYMKPGCEKCHGHLGFKLGDFRGGVGVSVPIAPYLKAKNDAVKVFAATHGAIWVLGLAGIGFGVRQIRGRIFERDRAEDEVTKSQDRLAGMLDIAPEAIISIDDDQKIQLFNKGAERIFGYSPEEVMDRSIEMLIPSRFRPSHAGLVRNFSHSNVGSRLMSERLNVWGLKKDGSEFPAEASISMLEHQGEHVLTAILTDITQRKQAEEQLRQSQKMEAVGQLTGGIAHEFNNLLMVIVGNLERSTDRVTDDVARKALFSAMDGALRAAELTNQLLAFSRKQELRIEHVDMNILVRGIRELLHQTLGETISVETQLTENIWPVLADRSLLESALLNLALNARDAMPKGGKIEIITTNTSVNSQMLSNHPNIVPGNFVSLQVIDTGTGMPAETLEKVFDPFFTTKDVGEGTGLGLSMVHGFVEQSGGFIAIESEPDHGAVVSIYLPRTDPKPINLNEETTEFTPIDNIDRNILVIEDDPNVRDHVLSLLSELGCQTIGAEDGPSALAQLRDHPDIDLILSDVVLPGGMSGPETVNEAKTIIPGVKVLFMSGYPRGTSAHQSRLDDSVLLIEKPFRRAEFANKLMEALAADR